MTTVRTLTETDVVALSDQLEDPQWLRDRRLESYKAFADLEWPALRDEEWRFTNPSRIDVDRELVSTTGTAAPIDSGVVAQLGDEIAAAVRLIDGGAATIEPRELPDGVIVADLATAAAEHPELVQTHLGSAVAADEKFAALASAAWTTGAFVYVPAETRVDRPITVTIQASQPGVHVQWVLLVAERHADLTVVLDQAGSADATVVNAVEAVLGDGAHLRLVTAQNWDDSVSHVTTHRGRVGRDAEYRHLELTLGGRTVYVRPDVWLADRGGTAELLGVYFATGEEKFEHRSLIFHDASDTSSEYVHKGALQDRAHVTWYGNIRIDVDAKNTTSDETNRNLILSPGAKADTLPFLEIETADVAACGHHSSVGQIDELQLFYLESRGIPRDEAARMLVYAFFAEVLERVDVPGVAETVLADLSRHVTSGPATIMDPRRSR